MRKYSIEKQLHSHNANYKGKRGIAKMKRTKKFASLLLALVMVFAMSVTAFAAGTNTITV